MTIISTNRETPFVFDHSHQQLIVTAGVTVAVEGANAVSDAGASNYDYCTVANSGGLYSSTALPVAMFGFGATVINYASGSLVGDGGVYFGGENAYLKNMGYIHGAAYGVHVEGLGAVLSNSGEITGGSYGIQVASGASFTLDNSGLIQGDSLALVGGDGASWAKVYNTGRMIGQVLLYDAGFCVLHNSGQIEGSVTFQGGDDRFDGRGGEVTGQVAGGGGADTLWGGAADDTLWGGLGGDRMKGGGGADAFVYTGVAESRGAAIDVIGGWDASDVLDLSQIDVNNAKAGIQHLSFGGLIGAADPVAEDKVQYYKQAGGTYVVADVNGDGHADLMVRIVGLFNLDANDFVLG
jgi:Ca2+-binding RTX toxin-like protein